MGNRPSTLPILILTGASGFIGRHFIEAFKDKFYIYAIARRSQHAAHVQYYSNLEWLRIDVGEKEAVEKVFTEIGKKGGADYVIHLAGFYDFENEPNPEFERTNINGTKFILEYSEKLNIKRFVFASSTTVTEFTEKPIIINENGPTDATFPYAVSKRICEENIRKYSEKFPCAIVRFAAIFSDWCEYSPLYILLSTWLSKQWNSKILAGKAEAAIPYLHINDLNNLLEIILEKSDILPQCPVFIASPDGCVSQKEIFSVSVRYFFGEPVNPFFIPKWFAWFGVIMMDWMGRLRGKRPFERRWMIKYIDKKMEMDASFTHKALGWKPVNRYNIKRRLLFLIENMKSNPYEWNRKNLEALTKEVQVLPNLKIYEVMIRIEEEIVNEITKDMLGKLRKEDFKQYHNLGFEKLLKRVKYIYEMLKTAVRTGDRLHILCYAHNLAIERFVEGFQVEEVQRAVIFSSDYIVVSLKKEEELRGMEQRIHDEIILTSQLILDELEDSFEKLTGTNE